MKKMKRLKKLEEPTLSAVEKITGWVGSVSSLIVHSFLFVGSFTFAILGLLPWDTMLLVLTTIVSLEAIYLAIFIQMTVNAHTKSLREVEEDIDEISEDLDDLEEDIDEIKEDVEEMTEDDERDALRRKNQTIALTEITTSLKLLLEDVENLKK